MDTRMREGALRPRAAVLAAALALALGTTGSIAATRSPEAAGVTDALSRIDRFVSKSRSSSPDALDAAIRAAASRARPSGAAIPVTDCGDSGPGTLRDIVVNVAVSGDTIDLSATGCSTITLSTGAIVAGQDDLTIAGDASPSGGPGATITGDFTFPLIVHIGTGTIDLDHVRVTNGQKYNDAGINENATGGCVFSSGTVSLYGARVDHCHVGTYNASYKAYGGAIYAAGGVNVVDSSVDCSSAGGFVDGDGGAIASAGPVVIWYSDVHRNIAFGDAGGVLAGGGLSTKYSTISDNIAFVAGGVIAGGSSTVDTTTIARNLAGTAAGGALIGGMGGNVALTQSTVSDNEASNFLLVIDPVVCSPDPPAPVRMPSQVDGVLHGVGGLILGGSVDVDASTIAGNTESGDVMVGAGLYLQAASTVDLQSTIVAGNQVIDSVNTRFPDDVGSSISTPAIVTGANNLSITFVNGLVPPPGTISADPMLLPLADNGGFNETRALSPGSPAIDAGNNTLGEDNDQRGSGFVREVGAAADIGAFERQGPNDGDFIFVDGFDPP